MAVVVVVMVDHVVHAVAVGVSRYLRQVDASVGSGVRGVQRAQVGGAQQEGLLVLAEHQDVVQTVAVGVARQSQLHDAVAGSGRRGRPPRARLRGNIGEPQVALPDGRGQVRSGKQVAALCVQERQVPEFIAIQPAGLGEAAADEVAPGLPGIRGIETVGTDDSVRIVVLVQVRHVRAGDQEGLGGAFQEKVRYAVAVDVVQPDGASYRVAGQAEELPGIRPRGHPPQLHHAVGVAVGGVDGRQFGGGRQVNRPDPVFPVPSVAFGGHQQGSVAGLVRCRHGTHAAHLAVLVLSGQLPRSRQRRRPAQRNDPIPRPVGLIGGRQPGGGQEIDGAVSVFRPPRAHEQFFGAVAVEVPRQAHAPAGMVVGLFADDLPRIRLPGDVGKIHDAVGVAVGGVGRRQPRGRDDVRGAGVPQVAGPVARGADDHLVPAVAVDVAGRGNAHAGAIVRVLSDKFPGTGLVGDRSEVDGVVRCAVGCVGRGKVRRRHQPGGRAPGLRGVVEVDQAEQEVAQAVAVDVARRRQALVLVGAVRDYEAVGGNAVAFGVPRQVIVQVRHAVVVVVRIHVVAGPVAVGVQPLPRVEGEGVGVVAHAVVVGVHPLGGVAGETVAIVAHAISVRIQGFEPVFGEGVAVVAHAVAVGVGPFGVVVGERVVGVGHAVVVVVGVGVVAGSVAIEVELLGRVVGEGVHRIDEAVLVSVGPGGLEIGHLEAGGVERGHRVRAVPLVDGHAAWRPLAVGIGIGELVELPRKAECLRIGHYGCELSGDAVAARPAKRTYLVLLVGMTQPHQMADLVRGGVRSAFAEHVHHPLFGEVVNGGAAARKPAHISPAAQTHVGVPGAEHDHHVGAVQVDQFARPLRGRFGERMRFVQFDFRDSDQPERGLHAAVAEDGVGEREDVTDAGAGVAVVGLGKAGAVKCEHVDGWIGGLRLGIVGVRGHQAFVDVRDAILVAVHQDVGIGGRDRALGQGLPIGHGDGFVGEDLAGPVFDPKLQVVVALVGIERDRDLGGGDFTARPQVGVVGVRRDGGLFAVQVEAARAHQFHREIAFRRAAFGIAEGGQAQRGIAAAQAYGGCAVEMDAGERTAAGSHVHRLREPVNRVPGAKAVALQAQAQFPGSRRPLPERRRVALRVHRGLGRNRGQVHRGQVLPVPFHAQPPTLQTGRQRPGVAFFQKALDAEADAYRGQVGGLDRARADQFEVGLRRRGRRPGACQRQQGQRARERRRRSFARGGDAPDCGGRKRLRAPYRPSPHSAGSLPG